MKPSFLIAIAAAGALSSSAAACPVYGNDQPAGGTSRPAARIVASAKATHSHTEICAPRIYGFAAHC